MAVKNMQNQKCGKLLVLERDASKTTAAAYWICQCECGNIKSVRGQSLRDGSVVDCGCGKKERTKRELDTTSLLYQTFGYLTVIQRDLTKPTGHGKDSYWICSCKCGATVSVRGTSLKNGSTKSCGCYRKEKNAQIHTLDLTNKRFGYLIAIEKTEDKNHGSYIWKCLCDCGNVHYVDAATLSQGKCSSCGCRTKSKGEEEIAKILMTNNIYYNEQYTFNDCRNPTTQYLYRYDFAILTEEGSVLRLIEFDGEQHFNNTSLYASTSIKISDNYKNEYAKKHSIPLIRIPYTKLKTLTLEDLMGDKYLL